MSKHKQLIREKFRDKVFKRDNYKCCFCDCIDDLDAHHITDRTEMPNGGYVVENGITLCPVHHLLAEKFHLTNGTGWINMYPTDLYAKINSSKEKAIIASNRI